MAQRNDQLRGRAWVFGDDVNTDLIIPSAYLVHPDPALWAQHAMEPIRPNFASGVRPGDFVIAGRSFGSGSSREHAAIALKVAGIVAVFAESVARNFYRNAFNNGLIVVEVPGVSAFARDGDGFVLDLESWRLTSEMTEQYISMQRLPPFLLNMADEGGLVPWLLASGGNWGSVDG